jgi:predicted metal-binding membrane protein
MFFPELPNPHAIAALAFTVLAFLLLPRIRPRSTGRGMRADGGRAGAGAHRGAGTCGAAAGAVLEAGAAALLYLWLIAPRIIPQRQPPMIEVRSAYSTRSC